MARKPLEEKTELLRMRVSVRLHAYLGHLARHTILGASENDVATYLLTRRLEEMIESGSVEKHRLEDD